MRHLSGVGRRCVTGAGVLLVLFHVWLFGSQAWSGQLADPDRLARWTVAAGLCAALVALRRFHRSSEFGRRAVAIWLTAGLLHVPAASQRLADANLPLLPEAMVALSPLVAASAFAAGVSLFAAWRATRSRSVVPVQIGWIARLARHVPSIRYATRLRLAPRPPPLILSRSL